MPLVRQAVTENGGLENYSVTKVLHWLKPRWPHAAFELTYSKLNPKLHSLREKLKKRQAAEVANAGAGTSAAAAPAPAPLVGDPATLSEGDAEMTHAGAVPTSAHAGAGTSAAGDVDPDDAGGVTTHALAVTAVGRDVEECASTLAALEVTHARSLEAQTAKLKDEVAELKAQNGELNQTITRLEGRFTLSNQAHQSEIAKNARVEKRFAVLKRKWEDLRALALQ